MNIGDQKTLHVATGQRPIEALTRAVRTIATGPWVMDVAVQHDDDCPSLDQYSMDVCTCEVVALVCQRLA